MGVNAASLKPPFVAVRTRKSKIRSAETAPSWRFALEILILF